jgi:hypothetical protein
VFLSLLLYVVEATDSGVKHEKFSRLPSRPVICTVLSTAIQAIVAFVQPKSYDVRPTDLQNLLSLLPA